MGQTKKRSPSGLLSEAGKKTGLAVQRTAKRVVGKKPPAGSKSATGLLSEAGKKAGRGVTDAARKAVGKKPTPKQKSGRQ